MKAIIYGFKTNDCEVFYIGSTKNTKEYRFKQHIELIKNNSHYNKHLANKVKKLGIENVFAIELETVELDRQFTREHELIQQYTKNGIRLTNIVHTPWIQAQLNQLENSLPDDPNVFANNILDYANYPIDSYPQTKIALAWDKVSALYVWNCFYGSEENVNALRDYLGESLLQSTLDGLEASLRYFDIKQSNPNLRTQAST